MINNRCSLDSTMHHITASRLTRLLCVCVCACACVRACVRACVCVCVCVGSGRSVLPGPVPEDLVRCLPCAGSDHLLRSGRHRRHPRRAFHCHRSRGCLYGYVKNTHTHKHTRICVLNTCVQKLSQTDCIQNQQTHRPTFFSTDFKCSHDRRRRHCRQHLV